MGAVAVAALGAISLTTSPWAALILLSRGVFDGLWQPLTQIYLNRLAATELRATLLSLQNLGARLALSATVGAFSLGTAKFGVRSAFGLAAVVAALSASLLLVTHPKARRVDA